MFVASLRLVAAVVLSCALHAGLGHRIREPGDRAPLPSTSWPLRRSIQHVGGFLGVAAILTAVGAAPEKDERILTTKLDSSGDGVIDRGEYRDATENFLNRRGITDMGLRSDITKYYDRLFTAGDVDGDGMLTPAEFDFSERLAEWYGMSADSMTDERAGEWKMRGSGSNEFGAEVSWTVMAMYDISGDGYLDVGEFQRGMTSYVTRNGLDYLLGELEVKAWMDGIWRRANINGDMFLDRDEAHFATLLSDEAMRSGWFKPLIVRFMLFRDVDTDGDRRIDRKEITAAEVAEDRNGPRLAARTRRLFQEVDVNRDGWLDEDEAMLLARMIDHELDSGA